MTDLNAVIIMDKIRNIIYDFSMDILYSVRNNKPSIPHASIIVENILSLPELKEYFVSEAREALSLMAKAYAEFACGDLCPISLKRCSDENLDCHELIMDYFYRQAKLEAPK